MANKTKCYVGNLTLNWRKENKVIDCTYVNQQTIYNKDLKLSYDIQAASAGIRFDECIMFAIPSSESIKKFIPNLTVLYINNSKLSKITSDDLKGFDWLRDLYVTNCEIEHLPGDLFKHTPNLEIISFRNNKIKYIDEGILEPLQNLKIFSLSDNVNINVCYDALNNNGDVTLAQLKNEMKNKCKIASEFWKIENKLSTEIGNLKRNDENQRKEIENLKKQNITLKKESDEQLTKISTLKTNDEVQKREIAELKGKYEVHSGMFEKLSSENENLKKTTQTEMNIMRGKNEDLEKKLETLSKRFCEIKLATKDFTIKVNSKPYSVHKAVLIAHSKVLANLIAQNPDAVDLELTDISDATFVEILNFMNEGSQPNKEANLIEVLGASCRLEIEALTTIVAKLLTEEVHQVNALDVLVLCDKIDKFNHYEELKMKAFAEFQKNFPHQTLLPELASQPEKLKLIMKAKLEMDEMIAEMHQAE